MISRLMDEIEHLVLRPTFYHLLIVAILLATIVFGSGLTLLYPSRGSGFRGLAAFLRLRDLGT
jgi:hypothetical protein